MDYTAIGVLWQHEDSLQRMGVARVDSLIIHGLDYAVAEVRTKAMATTAQRKRNLDYSSVSGTQEGATPTAEALVSADEAELALLAQLGGVNGGIAALQMLKSSGRIKAFGAALNQECPVYPGDEAAQASSCV